MRDYVFSRISLTVLSVCNAETFKSFALESSCFGVKVHLQNIYATFLHQNLWVKVKVTGAKSVAVYPVRGWSVLIERQS